MFVAIRDKSYFIILFFILVSLFIAVYFTRIHWWCLILKKEPEKLDLEYISKLQCQILCALYGMETSLNPLLIDFSNIFVS